EGWKDQERRQVLRQAAQAGEDRIDQDGDHHRLRTSDAIGDDAEGDARQTPGQEFSGEDQSAGIGHRFGISRADQVADARKHHEREDRKIHGVEHPRQAGGCERNPDGPRQRRGSRVEEAAIERAHGYLSSSPCKLESPDHGRRGRAERLGQEGTGLWTGANLGYPRADHCGRVLAWGGTAMPPAAEMIGSFRFSTGCLPVSERGTPVRALRGRGIPSVEPLPDRALRVQITKWSLPGAGILSGRLCGLRQEGTRQAAADDLFLGLNLAGRSTALQRQREIMIDHGDAVFLSCAEGPFTITRPTPVRFIGLRVPRRTLAPLVAGLDGPVMRVIPSATAGLNLLAKYSGGLVESQGLVSTEVPRLVAAHLRDLIALSCAPSHDRQIINLEVL